MLRFGEAPFLECSSKGDKRFSAFHARLRGRNNQSIEALYQAMKIFDDGSMGLSWKDAKGKVAVNMPQCREYYSQLWDEYFLENPDLIVEIHKWSGMSDVFGQPGHACQAEEIYRVKSIGLCRYRL